MIPFLKWPGGKRWAARRIAELVRPHLNGTYYEPFLGSGAVFFHLDPKRAVLSDINAELIHTYRVVKKHPKELLQKLRSMRVTKRNYYRVRAANPRSSVGRAVRFLYLNRTAFGGIYRLNGDGEFNVPYGGGERTPRLLWERNLLLEASKALRCAKIAHKDFEFMLDKAQQGDVVYCDPTYSVAHDWNGFIRYNERNFKWADQERLAAASFRAVHRGAVVIISNAHHHAVRSLYTSGTRHLWRRKSLVSTDPAMRRTVSEYLFVLRP